MWYDLCQLFNIFFISQSLLLPLYLWIVPFKHTSALTLNLKCDVFHVFISFSCALLSIGATRVLQNTMCNGAKLAFLRGFADTHSFPLWLPPVITGKVDRITTCVAVSVDLFLAKMTGTWPDVSWEVQHFGILPCFVLTVAPKWHLLNQSSHSCFQNQQFACLPKCSGNNLFRPVVSPGGYHFRGTLVPLLFKIFNKWL